MIDLLKSDRPVLVKFTADWCPPCKVMEPRIAAVVKDYKNEIAYVEIDMENLTDEERKFAMKSNVRGIPTVAVFVKGKEIGRVVGAVPKTSVENIVKKALDE